MSLYKKDQEVYTDRHKERKGWESMSTLRQLREEAVLTQAELAEQVGVSATAISHWETGNKRPRASNIRSLAKALGISPQEVLAAIRETQSSQKQQP